MNYQLQVHSNHSSEMINITSDVKSFLDSSDIRDGLCILHVPHTTAAVTINENADPDVQKDMLLGLSKLFPEDPEYSHFEHNSSAHLRSSVIGADQTLIIQDGQLLLGTWQGIYFCEFDGPRNRHIHIKFISTE